MICNIKNRTLNLRKLSFLFFLFFSYNTLFAQSDTIEVEEVSLTDTTFTVVEVLDSIPEVFRIEDNLLFLENKRSKPKDIYEQPYSLWANYPNYKGLARNTGVLFGASFAAAGILYLMPESVSNWDKEKMKKDGIFSKWKENVKAGPVFDNDDWVLNYVTHPYFGAVYYMSARSLGFNAGYSFLYSAMMSTFFWEYGIESFAEIPSIQDLIVTPVGGAILGEAFFLAKRSIVANNYYLLNSRILGHTATFLMDPVSEVMDLCTGKFKKKKNISLTSHPVILPSGRLSYNVSFNLCF